MDNYDAAWLIVNKKNTFAMKRKILLFIIRIVRLLKMQDRFIPELEQVPLCKVKPHRLYQHYGRILLSRRNPRRVEIIWRDGLADPISEREYYRLFSSGQPCYIDIMRGQACMDCAMRRLGLPCRCDFSTGAFTGWYELIASSKQYSDNITI